MPILSLQQTLDGRHFCALLRYRLCMLFFPLASLYLSCGTSMDIYGDHALLHRGDPSSAGFQLRHRMVQQSLGTILRQAGICHAVEPPHLRLQRDDSSQSGRGSGLTRPADILLYSWRGDSHCCVDLVGVSPARGGWRDAASALALLSVVSVRSMLTLAGPMALTSSRFTSPPLAPLVLRRRSSSLAYASVTVLMLGCPHGRHILGSIVAYLLRLLGVWLSSLLVGNC